MQSKESEISRCEYVCHIFHSDQFQFANLIGGFEHLQVTLYFVLALT